MAQEFQKTPRQQEALKLLGDPNITNILLSGGARSGKTFLLCYTIFVRALKSPGSRHLMLRLRFSHAKQSLALDTIPKMLRLCFPGLDVKLSKVDWYYTLPNGSEVWIGGLDDGERVEKILGKEFCSIYFNEASQLAYASIGTVKTRLAMKCEGLVNKLYYDCNPPNKRHWLYKIWIEGKNPYNENMPLALPETYGYFRMNPADNAQNLADDYIETQLSTLSERDVKRFRDGEFTDDAEGALFKWETLSKSRVHKAPDLYRVVVGIDPAVSANDGSNSTGIVVAGVALLGKDKHYYVLDDLTMVGTPYQWAKAATDAYENHQADRIVAEINQGGDLVESNLRTIIPDIPYQPVRATRGKQLRAEPIAALAEKGQLHLVGEHSELENELTSWAPASGEPSPDRMDAMVWAITALMGKTKRIGTW